MIRPVLLAAATLCAGLPALSAAGVPAVPPAAGQRLTTTPAQPQPRRGDYRVQSRGSGFVHARCTEGGHVFMWLPPAGAEPAARRRRAEAVREACQAVDYSK